MPKPPRSYRAPKTRRSPSAERQRFEGGFTGLLGEFDATVQLVRSQRELLECELKKAGKDLKNQQHIVWMTVKLTSALSQLLREGRQLQKQYAQEDMSEAEALQTLIDAGWRPPTGWSAPEGVVVPAEKRARREALQ